MEKMNGKAITSLVLGILSIITVFLDRGAFFGLVFGIIGLVFAISASKEITAGESKGIAIAGLVCSIIGVVINGCYIISCVACASAALGVAACMSFY